MAWAAAARKWGRSFQPSSRAAASRRRAWPGAAEPMLWCYSCLQYQPRNAKLEIELTARFLELRAAPEDAAARWSSRVCQDRVRLYEPTPSGFSVTLEAGQLQAVHVAGP